MPENDENDPASSEGGDSRSRIWRGLRVLLFGDAEEPSLRSQIEDAIDDHDEAGPSHRLGAGGTASDLSPVERQMLRNMLHFGERTADDVAVPRRDILAISETASFAELVKRFAGAGHSRLPVFRGSLDQVVGMVHIKDLFDRLVTGETGNDWSKLIRQPLYVPMSMGVIELLAEMRSKRTHLAVVVDEYSGTDGLVTIEDLVEEIVGDIEDEHDDAAQDTLVAVENGCWDADARVELEEVGVKVAPSLSGDDEDVDTLGGLAFVLAGHVPQPGEIVTHASGWRLEVVEGDRRRVTRIRIHPPALREGGTQF